jgi:hypothetical protein
VFGTTRYLSARDYGPEGFLSEHALVAVITDARDQGLVRARTEIRARST